MAAVGGQSGVSSSVPSLPPPRPRSPPQYPDLYGKRREAAKLQMLEREKGFLEEELKFVEGLQPASRCCKEVADFVTSKSDPLIPTRSSCFSFSWLCCCAGCSCHLKLSDCCCCNVCDCCSCSGCSLPKWHCSCPSCPCICAELSCPKCCCKFKLPSCFSCNCCKFTCSCPKVKQVCSCFSCRKNCCDPSCCICF